MIIEILLNAAAPFGRYSYLWLERTTWPDRPEIARRPLRALKMNKLRSLNKINALSPPTISPGGDRRAARVELILNINVY
jgi:hypothetical protein